VRWVDRAAEQYWVALCTSLRSRRGETRYTRRVPPPSSVCGPLTTVGGTSYCRLSRYLFWEVLGGLDGTGFAIPFHSFPLHPFALSAEPHPSAPRLTISQREVELASPVPSPHASPRPSWLPSLYCRSAVCTSMLPWRCGTRSNNVMTANGHRSSPRARSRNLPVYCTVELATCPILSRPVAKRESVCVQRPG
jgi:hypothetical protein